MSDLDLTEAQIAVHWKEEEYFQPPKKFIQQANLKLAGARSPLRRR